MEDIKIRDGNYLIGWLYDIETGTEHPHVLTLSGGDEAHSRAVKLGLEPRDRTPNLQQRAWVRFQHKLELAQERNEQCTNIFQQMLDRFDEKRAAMVASMLYEGGNYHAGRMLIENAATALEMYEALLAFVHDAEHKMNVLKTAAFAERTAADKEQAKVEAYQSNLPEWRVEYFARIFSDIWRVICGGKEKWRRNL